MRLDNYLVKFNFFDSRTKANQAIKRGEVFINNYKQDKPSFEIDEKAIVDIQIKSLNTFVSLGGFKLFKGLNDFNIDVNNLICCDVGASTGGFTDCLLQNGAKKVFAVDLNDQLLHYSLKNDDRVVAVIKNAKNLLTADFDDQIDFLCADLSFISATQVMQVFYSILKDNGDCVVLIKPQFETGGKKKFKNGIIKDEDIRLNACKEIYDFSISCGFVPKTITTAPIVKGKNVEYLIYLKKDNSQIVPFDKIFIK